MAERRKVLFVFIMAGGLKRARDVMDLEHVDGEEIASANIHVYVTSLSPLKKGRK